MKHMVQVLCYTGRGFDTAFRPGRIAAQSHHVQGHAVGRCTPLGLEQVVYTPIRFTSA